MKEIKLGQKVKDIVTGLEGIASAKIEYLNGCIQYCIKPKVKKGDNKEPDGVWIDISQIKIIDDGLHKNIKPKPTGGSYSDAPKM